MQLTFRTRVQSNLSKADHITWLARGNLKCVLRTYSLELWLNLELRTDVTCAALVSNQISKSILTFVTPLNYPTEMKQQQKYFWLLVQLMQSALLTKSLNEFPFISSKFNWSMITGIQSNSFNHKLFHSRSVGRLIPFI